MAKVTYKRAGVDIDAADRFIGLIKPLVRSTVRPEVLGGIGGFSGLFRPRLAGMKKPVLVSSTDGVGVTNGVPGGATGTCLLESIGRGLCVQDSLTTLNPLENKYLTPISTGNRAQYGLSVQGGSELVRYFVSGEYEDETGTLKLPKYEENRLLANRGELDPWVMRPNVLDKTSLRANINASPSAKVDVGVSVGYVTSEVRLPRTTTTPWESCRAVSLEKPRRRTLPLPVHADPPAAAHR